MISNFKLEREYKEAKSKTDLELIDYLENVILSLEDSIEWRELKTRVINK